MNKELQTRRDRLQRKLRMLSDRDEPIVFRPSQTEAGALIVRIERIVRIPEAKVLFRVKEEHRDLDREVPTLHSFSYHLGPQDDITMINPHFRFECHPDVKGGDDDSCEYASPYAIVPHFHPAKNPTGAFVELHYPFGRGSRRNIFFALVDWLHRDFLLRYHSARRFNDSPWIVPGGPERSAFED